MKDYGETDDGKRQIRINKTASKKTPGGILDTIVHEEMHRAHPKMTERAVRKKTPRKIEHMGKKHKARYYGMYK